MTFALFFLTYTQQVLKLAHKTPYFFFQPVILSSSEEFAMKEEPLGDLSSRDTSPQQPSRNPSPPQSSDGGASQQSPPMKSWVS